MVWLNEIVDEIIDKFPNEDVYICECGLSTTGISHIGNFRELLITYFVSKELERRGKKTKVILSFDDFDRLKKVTKGVDPSFEEYVGMPNYMIPAPYGENYKYAEYFENLVINELKLLGINMNYIKQSERYLNGDYNDKIQLALNTKDNIYDIISKYKTKAFMDKSEYYPISLYCSNCFKDSTKIINYDGEKVEYECKCGYHERDSIDKLKIKLNFGIDWPMRWNYENVSFEACGKGHADKNGALNVAKDISKNIFSNRQPVNLVYEFVNFKSSAGRLSKDSKRIVTITDALEIMPKDMILWMFLTNNPKKEYSISFDESIIKLYKEYEKVLTEDDKCANHIKEIIGKSSISVEPEFDKLIRFLPISNFSIDNLKKYVSFDENNKDHLRKIKYAYNWLKKYSNDKYWEINNEFNNDYWISITQEQKELLAEFNKILTGNNIIEETEIFISKLKESKKVLKQFSKDFYNMVFGTDKGIPIKSVVENYDVNKILKMLTPERNLQSNKNDNIALLHLSDLHFDVDDSQEVLNNKWNEMISFLMESNLNIKYLIVTGDIICFYNMEANYELAEKFINLLIDKLDIDRSNVLLCMGNHEMIAYNEDIDYHTIFDDFSSNIKPKINQYSTFQHKINNKDINAIDDMYYIKSYDDFTFLIVNSLYYLDKNNNGMFLHDIEKVRDLLSTYVPEEDKFKILIMHAQDKHNDDLNKKTDINSNFNIKFCGHKNIQQHIETIKKQDEVEVIAGSTDGLIENENSYNLYVLENDSINVKKVRYKKKWNLE